MTAIREQLIAAILTATSGQYGLTAPEDERDLPLTLVQDAPDTATQNYDFTACAMPISLGRAEVAASIDRNAARQQESDP